MAKEENKKDGFVLYASQYESIKDLSSEQKGNLLDFIFQYVLESSTPEIADGEVRMAFKFIKNQIDMDCAKYERIKQKRAEAGRRHRGNQFAAKTEQTEQNGTNGTNGTNVPFDNKTEQTEQTEHKEKVEGEGIGELNKSSLPPMPPKGSEPKKEKPLWKESYEEWRRLFLEAKDELLNDSEFKKKQEHFYQNIDYVKSIEKNCDYWLREDTWKKEKRKRTQTILAKQRILNNFDKNKVFLPFQRNREEEQDKEPSLQERHTNFISWLSKQVKDPNTAMPIFHVTLDDFIEMLNACGGDANKLASTVHVLLGSRITAQDGLIGAFRKCFNFGV